MANPQSPCYSIGRPQVPSYGDTGTELISLLEQVIMLTPPLRLSSRYQIIFIVLQHGNR